MSVKTLTTQHQAEIENREKEEQRLQHQFDEEQRRVQYLGQRRQMRMDMENLKRAHSKLKRSSQV